MEWEVEFTDEFGVWWNTLSAAEQEDVRAYVKLLQEDGPNLKFPYNSGIAQSAYDHMRELRVQHTVGLTGSYMHSIPGGLPYYSLVATKPETINGTTFSSQLPTVSMERISFNSRGKNKGAAPSKGKRMARKFKELESKMPARSIRRSDEKARTLKKEMALNELRAARDITQEHLAGLLHVNQAAISKLERRTDMYVSTLGNFVRAMGGRLELTVHFPEGTIRIKKFRDIKSSGIGNKAKK